jgi:hypothetical protein
VSQAASRLRADQPAAPAGHLEPGRGCGHGRSMPGDRRKHRVSLLALTTRAC